MLDPEARVALVHDYMAQLGGAERVAGILASEIPSARLLTSIHRPEKVPLQIIGAREWETSFLQPLSRLVPLKAMLPLLPRAMASLDVSNCDVVISSSSAVAHHVRPAADATHVCYCATPAHFLWNQTEYFHGRPQLQRLLRPLLDRLQRLDVAAAAKVDAYLANSEHTAKRIREVYGREAAVVHPPVQMPRFQPSRERSRRFLVVSRLVASKRVDLVVAAANRYSLPLDVIGTGPEHLKILHQAGPTVRVLGWRDDAFVRRAMAECEAVIVAGEEDFGLVIAEAQASGRPPVAFASGGALEIIEDGLTGFLFDEQTPESLGAAMQQTRERELHTTDLLASAERFDVPVFLKAFRDALIDAKRAKAASRLVARSEATGILT